MSMDTIVEEGADVAGKKDRQKAVKFDEATEALAYIVSDEANIGLSEVIRIAICHSAAAIITSPFVRKIRAEDVDISRILELRK